MNKNFDLILFDLDGTLTDSGEGIMKCVQYALSKKGVDEQDLGNLRRFVGPPMIESYMEFYGFSKEEAIELRGLYNERYRPIGWKENHPYEGIMELLETLRAEGKLLGVATSKPADSADKVLELFDMKKYFHVISAGSIDGLKCSKEVSIQRAIQGVKDQGYEVKNPVLVGDTKYDVVGAHECGIPCIGVTWGYAAEGEFEAHNTEYVVNTMEELLNILK